MNTKNETWKRLKNLLEASKDLAKAYIKDAMQIRTRREYFWRKYPEIFNDSSENEVEMDIDEGQTRPKKPNLAEIRERLLYKRMAERFTMKV